MTDYIQLTLKCAQPMCYSDEISFASAYTGPDPQKHVDNFVKFRCNTCFACNWQVQRAKRMAPEQRTVRR